MAKAYRSTRIDILDKHGNKIGAIRSFNPSVNRNITPLRELNSDLQGEIVDLVEAPETTTISVNGFAVVGTLAKKNFIMNRIAADETLEAMKEQDFYFDIREKFIDPATGETITIVYVDCKLQNYSHSVNIDGDTIIAETASIMCRKVVME